MTKNLLRYFAILWLLTLPAPPTHAGLFSKSPVVLSSPDALRMEVLAAREIRRYVYLRTTKLLEIESVHPASLEELNGVIVGRKDSLLVLALGRELALPTAIRSLQAQEYLIKTIHRKGHPTLVLVVGGDEVGTLYGAYRLAEHLGVRFYLHGDVVPDERTPLRWPEVEDHGAPLFALRGIQPFHDFPEGPDWWNQDDYLSIVSQLPKLRMNFLGLHTYPEGGPNAEPTVWIGLPSDVGEGAAVKFSYPASYQNTQRGNWGYLSRKTSDFSFGASELFERDDFGPDVMLDCCPQPKLPQECNAVFDLTGRMLGEAFRAAHRLGIKTCVGTETPLTVPKAVAERLKSLATSPTNAVVQELYEGIFRRASAAYDLDYYWFWTPEGWTWEGTKPAQIAATTNDLLSAIAAAGKVGARFNLATCGWVLGPQSDRAMFDKILPKTMPVSCINREVGRTPVEKGFAAVSGRPKWAIPWMEDDPGLTSPQLWAGRMRRDAADARRYGCDGLMGIHWRTRVLAPNVAALSEAAWDQDDWAGSVWPSSEPPRVPGPVGGQVASFSNHPIADTPDAPLYQTVRYNLSAYHWPVTNGTCAVTLKFCEPHYTNSGKRVFDVKLQGKTVLENLDVFARVGQNRALDCSFKDVEVTNGWVDVEFIPRVEYPIIAALSITGPAGAQNINCGGESYHDYIAEPTGTAAPKPSCPATDDFYRDWAAHEFGREAGGEAAQLFTKLDCSLPRPSDWVDGPGGIKADKRPWDKVLPEYAFVDELAASRPRVKGAGNLERFDYWLNTFRYMRAIGHVNCVRAEFDRAMEKVTAEKDSAIQKELARTAALPLYRELTLLVGEVYRYMLATVSNPGEIGTVANWEQHLLPDLLGKSGKELAKCLGEDLPADTRLASSYHGPTRVIVPTMRSSFRDREALGLKVIVLSEQPPQEAAVHWRRLGRGKFSEVKLRHVARGVYSAQFPPEATAGTDLEYFIKVAPAKGAASYFPATAPAMNQTLVAESQ